MTEPLWPAFRGTFRSTYSAEPIVVGFVVTPTGFQLTAGAVSFRHNGHTTWIVEDGRAVFRGDGRPSLPKPLKDMLFPDPVFWEHANDAVPAGDPDLRLDQELGVITRGKDENGVAELQDVEVISVDPDEVAWSGPEQLRPLSSGTAFVSSVDELAGADREWVPYGATLEIDLFGYGAYWEPGPSEVLLDEALAWARARASRVLLRVAGIEGVKEFSAGDEPIGSLDSWAQVANADRHG